ncbi:hypothetical protein D3C79_634990 [compost metagenome]
MALIVLDFDVLVALGMDVQLLGALLVLHADFVEVRWRATFARTAFHPALSGIGRQVVGHGLLGVVHPASDDRPVRITFKKADDHFLADPRDLHRAPVLAGPGLGHADPARAVLVGLVMAVPVEVHLDPAILVGPDLFTGRTDHDGGLRSLDLRAQGAGQGAEALLRIDAAEVAFELRVAATGTSFQALLDDVVAGADDQVFAVLVLAAEPAHAEQVARCQAPGVAAQLDALVQALQGLDAGTGVMLAVLALHVGAGVVV